MTNRAVFDLMRGSARVVTGKVAAANPKQFFFRLPQTQLTVERPADFTVALVNPAYVTVNAGSVISSNTYGVSTLAAGSTSAIATNAAAVASHAGFGVAGDCGFRDEQSQRRCRQRAGRHRVGGCCRRRRRWRGLRAQRR